VKKAFVGAVAVLCLLVAVPAAYANPTPTGGFLEVCKNADSAHPVTGPFTFTIDGRQTVSVPVGACTAPLPETAGDHVVVEQPNSATAETAASTIPSDRLQSSNLSARTQVVDVVAGDVSKTTTLEVTNTEVTGFLEVCKNSDAASPVTGSFTFDVSGALGYTNKVTVPVGACSQSFAVPAGTLDVQEEGSPAVTVTKIAATPSADLLSANLTTDDAKVAVVAGDISHETIVSFTNARSVSDLKVCKAATDGLIGKTFPFTANGQAFNVIAGPPQAPLCALVGTFTTGTQVAIQEGIVPGTQVADIEVAPNGRVVDSSLSLANRSVTVNLGSGETVVTYTDVPAQAGLLKLCKDAGPGIQSGQVFAYQVSGIASPVLVPAGYCAIASSSIPFDTTETIQEAVPKGDAVTAITVAPPGLEVGSPDLPDGIVKTLVGAGVTEVTYTNTLTTTAGGTLPPPVVGPTPPPVPPVTVPTPTPAPVPVPVGGHHHHPIGVCVVVVREIGQGPPPPSAGLGDVHNPVLSIQVKGDARVCDLFVKEFGVKGTQVARVDRHARPGHTIRVSLSHQARGYTVVARARKA
jgi:hypothetical protein